jgi:hypothetical protein
MILDWALRNACLSRYERGVHADRASWQRELKRAPARVQWDPERDLYLRQLPYRSLQLGLAGEAARRYADEWTVSIADVTPLAQRVRALVRAGDVAGAGQLLPLERPYAGRLSAREEGGRMTEDSSSPERREGPGHAPGPT